MSWIEHTRSLFAYNEWANQKVLDAAAALGEEFGRQVSGNYERADDHSIVRVKPGGSRCSMGSAGAPCRRIRACPSKCGAGSRARDDLAYAEG
jgi:hypothetical protein